MRKCLLDKEIWLIQGISIRIFETQAIDGKKKLLFAAFATFVAVDGWLAHWHGLGATTEELSAVLKHLSTAYLWSKYQSPNVYTLQIWN